MDRRGPDGDRVPVQSTVAEVIVVPAAVGVAVGVIVGSAWLAALVAAAAIVAVYWWRSHFLPSRPPRDLRRRCP
jgi:O-antigen/teichoic acid export membrane protein